MIKENRQEEIMQQHSKSGKFGKQEALQEIQEENRRLILEAIHGVSYGEALRKEIEFAGWSFDEEKDLLEHNVFTYRFKVTLNRVLFALQNKVDYMVFGLNYSHATFDSWWITSSGAAAGIIEIWICKWDLNKETLECQSEETQRSINKLLTE